MLLSDSLHNKTETESFLASTLSQIDETSYKANHMKMFTCRSEKLGLSFQVHVEDYTVTSQPRCHVMTIHDLGYDYNQFQDFVHCNKMNVIKSHTVWLHVNLPGQGSDASALNLRKYPTLEELAEELICVVDFLKISQLICMGDGAGANIASLFAMRYPNRCLGIVLVEPIGTSANLFESIKYRLGNFKGMKNTKASSINKFEKLVTKSFASSTSSSPDAEKDSLELPLNDFDEKKVSDNYNMKNLELFAQSFYNRSNLIEKVRDISVDALIAVGKNSNFYGETKKFYNALQSSHKQSRQKMVNTPFLEIDNVSNLLKECPDRLAISFQYFLQGIGLLPGIPMRGLRTASMSTSYGRSLSIEEADRQNSSSQSDSSQFVSSNPSLNNV